MSSTITETETRTTIQINDSELKGPFEYPSRWDQHIDRHLTPAIGTQINSDIQLSKVLEDDRLIHELGVLVARRGVVFFKNQDITPEQQAKLGQALGILTGKPKSHSLHVHPLTPDFGEFGQAPAVFSLDEKFNQDNYDDEIDKSEHAADNWHTDVTFENVPSDYALLKMHTIPELGGDTLWSSAYSSYDKLSPAMREFLGSLKAVHHAPTFQDAKRVYGLTFRGEKETDEGRGADQNRGGHLKAVHPVIRTNPVTGWNGVFVNRAFTKRIVGLTVDESRSILEYLFRLQESHDLTVKYQWQRNDLAIWDNRSTFHAPTNDHNEIRRGDRVLGIGEIPFYSQSGKSRAADLKERQLRV